MPAYAAKVSHKFLKLDVKPSRLPLADGEKYNLNLEAILKSTTGFQKERLIVLLDNKAISKAEDFKIEQINESHKARISFSKNDLPYQSKATNRIKILFSDTELAQNTLAEREKNIFNNSRDVFNNDPVLPDDTAQELPIVKLKVALYDDSNNQSPTQSLQVSNDKKKFLLTFEHDPNYIQGESLETFSAANSVLLNNLKIFSIDANGKKTNITSRFFFKLEADSSHKFANFNTTLTQFSTAGIAFNDIQTLDFVVDVKDYLKKINVFFPDNAVTKSERIVNVVGEKLALTDIKLNDTNLVFYEDKSNSKFNMLGSPLLLNANYDPNSLNISSLSAFVFNTKDIDKHPLDDLSNLKLLINSEQKIPIDLNYELSKIKQETGKIEIPLQISIDKPKGFFVKNHNLTDISVPKSLNLDFSLVAKDSNNLDKDLRGNLNANITIKFIDSPNFIDKSVASIKFNKHASTPSLNLKFDYSNSVDMFIDPLDLLINLLDENSQVLASTKIENFSSISKKATATFNKTLDTSLISSEFFNAANSAKKAEIKIIRDQDYLNRLKLDTNTYPMLLETASLILSL